MKFSKLQVAGNDFILVDILTQTLPLEESGLGESEAESRCKRDNLPLTIDTLTGIRQVRAYMSGNKVSRVEVNMGLPQFQPEQISVEVKVDIILTGKILMVPWNRVGKVLPSGAVKEAFTGEWLEGRN
jgi:diaminopimelate epimerase